MKARIILSLALLTLASCAVDRDAGRLYQAEREFYRADWTYKNLSIRPQDVSDEDWAALADSYEKIGRQYGTWKRGEAAGPSREQMRVLAARGLFAAAQLRGGIRDSLKVDAIYRKMADDFGDIPAVAAEVALARANIAEAKGDFPEAIELYRNVVDLVEPDPAQPGVQSAVLGLPLHIARLRAIAGEDRSLADQAYDEAKTYYERISNSVPGSLGQLDASAYLAELAAERGDFGQGVRILEALETQLRGMKDPPREPANVILARSELLVGAAAPPERIRGALETILHDYPKSAVAPQALIALAGVANQQDRPEEALAYLDRVGLEYKENEEMASQALLLRARLLESRNRWPEALETFRSLTSQHALSDAALAVPLAIAEHYHRAGDEGDTRKALEDAESHFRDFLTRYPPSRFTITAREGLVRALVLQEKYDAAVTEMVKLGEDLAGSRQGANWLASAAAMANGEMSDPQRAAGILDRMSEIYANADAGTWAANQARILRETPAP